MMTKMMKRRGYAFGLVFVMLVFVFVIDSIVSKPLNPFSSPALFALGSGEAASGALCTSLPQPIK